MAAGEARHTEIMNGRPGSAASTHTTDGAALGAGPVANGPDSAAMTAAAVANWFSYSAARSAMRDGTPHQDVGLHRVKM